MMRFTSACACLLPLLPGQAFGKVYTFPPVLHNGTVTEETVAGVGGSLDGPKLSSTANITSYEWWYFDVVSTTSLNESVDIVFYNAGPEGFPSGSPGGPLSVEVSGSFANGSLFDFQAAATVNAVVVVGDDGSVTGDWDSAGASFNGSSLTLPGVVYSIDIDSEEFDIHGSVTMHAVAPANYPCGPDIPGADEIAFTGVGWAVAVPDSNAVVELDVQGTPLRFSGLGYHDKNWGLTPFTSSVNDTYWGHARLGPYSLVWSSALVPDGAGGTGTVQKFASSVTRDGRSVTVSCAQEAVVVRPWGANDEYPPTATTGPPQGLELVFDLAGAGGVAGCGGGGGDVLRVNVTSDLVVINEGVYQRILGSVTGSLGRQRYEGGRALFEQFKLIA